jgi:hypothetical protein
VQGRHVYRVTNLGLLVHNASFRLQSLRNTANSLRGIGVADYLDPLTNKRLVGDLNELDGDHMLPTNAVVNAIELFRDQGGTLSSNQKRAIATIVNGSDNLHLMPFNFNRSKGNSSMADWLGSGLGGQISLRYARFVAGRQQFIASQVDSILGGSFVDRSFFNQVIRR